MIHQPSHHDAASAKLTGDVARQRLLSLDSFRGITLLAMVMVNNPGSWSAMYWPLAHADWHGWTPTDLIFPFFIFIVGTALAYSLRKYQDGAAINSSVYWRIVRRTALLIFLGWFPALLFRTIDFASGAATSLDLENLRLPGVLVRIGIVYFITTMIVLHVRLRAQVAVAVAILLGYWGLLAWLPNPHNYEANLSRDGNLVGLIDRTVIGLNHMYLKGGNTDPEGILSTFPAVITALIGYWTGLFIQRRGLNYGMIGTVAAAGLVLAAVGQGWHFAFPINKKIWTSSFVLLTGGLAMVGLAGCLLKFDLWGWRRLARPFAVVGMNSILVFVGSGLMATALNRIPAGSERNLHDWLLDTVTHDFAVPLADALHADWMADPKFPSLCYSLVIVAFWWLACWIFDRLGWHLKV